MKHNKDNDNAINKDDKDVLAFLDTLSTITVFKLIERKLKNI